MKISNPMLVTTELGITEILSTIAVISIQVDENEISDRI